MKGLLINDDGKAEHGVAPDDCERGKIRDHSRLSRAAIVGEGWSMSHRADRLRWSSGSSIDNSVIRFWSTGSPTMTDLHDNIARLVIGSTSVSHHHRILPMFPSSQYLLHLGRIYRINN